MSTTRINVTEVVNSLQGISSAQSTVSDIAWGVAATGGGVDSAILGRNGIGWRLNSVQSKITQIAQKIQAINDAISSGAMQYGQTEAAIVTLGSQVGAIGSKNASAKDRSRYEDYFIESPEKVKQNNTEEPADWAKNLREMSKLVSQFGQVGIATSGIMRFVADMEGGMTENEAKRLLAEGTGGFVSALGSLAEWAYKKSDDINVSDILLGKWQTSICDKIEIKPESIEKNLWSSSVGKYLDRFNFDSKKTVGENINVATAWAGIAVSAVTTGIDNLEEFGTAESERFWEETILETGIDVAVGAGASIVASAAVTGVAAALGTTVAMLAVVVGIATVGILWVADAIAGAIAENMTGERKDLNETVSDIILDSDIYQEVKGLAKQYGHFETDWRSCYGI